MADETIDKTLPILGMDVTQCEFCRHLRKMGTADHFGWKCVAFGDEDIPGEILDGFWDHRRAYESLGPGHRGDGGIMFDQGELDPGLQTFGELFGPVNPLEDEDGVIPE